MLMGSGDDRVHQSLLTEVCGRVEGEIRGSEAGVGPALGGMRVYVRFVPRVCHQREARRQWSHARRLWVAAVVRVASHSTKQGAIGS
jgi:hypothetical protein